METLYLVGKIILSIIFFVMTIAMIYLCIKAESIKYEFARLERLCVEDLKKVYDTGSVISKVVFELVLARYSVDLNKFIK
jgi:hypothetical protein